MSYDCEKGGYMLGQIITDPKFLTSYLGEPDPGASAYRIIGLNPIKLVKVICYPGFGWLTDDEITKLRLTDPRLAP